MIRVSVMYPNDGGRFNLDYYLNTHKPLVHKLLEPYGLLRLEVDKGIGGGGPGTPAPYIAIGHLIFEDPESMQKGLQAHDPDLAADLPNFTDIKPHFQVSEIMA